MSEIYVYHVVTEKPMHLGQQITFDESHHSGVYQRVMDKVNIVNDIYAHAEKYESKKLEHHTSVALRELALEEVRKAQYPMYPSRMACLYVSKSLKEAENWFDFFTKIGRSTYQIVKLKVNGNCFTGDATKCFDGSLCKEKNLKLAEKYWENLEESNEKSPIVEMLVDGEIEVVEIMKERI